jgi:hypothetical protein
VASLRADNQQLRAHLASISEQLGITLEDQSPSLTEIAHTMLKSDFSAPILTHDLRLTETNLMDLASPLKNKRFAKTVGYRDHLPQDICIKVHHALVLCFTTTSATKILPKVAWVRLGQGVWRPGLERDPETTFEEECALAGALLRDSSLAPSWWSVIMVFGNAEQQQLLPIGSGEVCGARLQRAGRWFGPGPTQMQGRTAHVHRQRPETWTTLGQYGEWIFCLVAPQPAQPQTGIASC